MSATIDIDFREGTIEGDFGNDRVGLIAALETLATELRKQENGLAYICYDEGKIFAG